MVNIMKFLVIFSYSSENAVKVRERFKTWSPPEGMSYVFPPHSIIGANKSVNLVEAENEEALAKAANVWTDLGSFKIYPLIDSRESLKLG